MQKEKVNTHFSFPMRLDMSGYVEKTLLPQQYRESKTESLKLEGGKSENKCSDELKENLESVGESEMTEQCEYNLIGVTVHTGNADGGHYYSFIKERNGQNSSSQDRWFLFNDAEVKQFDPSQIEAECFGGEMTSKTYDTVTEKYLDFSFEKTNSAYMLFYERCYKTSDDQIDIDRICLDEEIKMESLASCSKALLNPQSSSRVQSFDKSTINVKHPFSKSESQDDSILHSKTVTQSTNNDSLNDRLICDIDIKAESNRIESTHKANEVNVSTNLVRKSPTRYLLNKELEDWIWEDNRYFLQDRNIFEHTYFK